MNTRFIASASTHHAGGNCMADVLELRNGQAIVIGDDALSLYRSARDFHDNSDETTYVQMQAPEFDGIFARVASSTALTFVERLDVYEPDGPVSVDLVVLADGRVLGIDTDTIVLYPSMEAFDATDGTVCYPTLDLRNRVPH